MTNRSYRLIFGFIILMGLYFEAPMVLYALIGLALIEGRTSLCIPPLAGEGSLGLRWLGFRQ